MTNTKKNPAGTPATTAPKSATEIAEQCLGDIDWMSSTVGYCECPGKNRHTTKQGKRDCRVYLEGAPTLFCLHASCGPAIKEANQKLRNAIRDGSEAGDGKPRKLTAEDKAKLSEREQQERVRQRAAKSLPQILTNHEWTYKKMIADSPTQVVGNEKDHWRLLLKNFEAGDVVWIGDTFDSGKPMHAKRFRTVTQWLKESKAPGPFVCPSAFKSNSTARSNDNVLNRRFLVVESDMLGKDQVGAIFRWLRDVVGLELVAVVDTAGKSLHGWFRYPHEHIVDEMRLVLPALQCDPKLFTPSQPVRLPGAKRDGNSQKLVYLAKGVTNE